MTKKWESGACNEKSGFLFNHECFRPPSAVCSLCQKPICDDHTHLSDQAGQVCTSCAKKRQKPGRRGQSSSQRGRSSHDHHDRYNEPYFYGGYYFGTSYYDSYQGRGVSDPHDFTEADAESLASEMDEGFENDMSES